MGSEATPRVNATLLERFSGQIVRIIGRVTSLRGETATIDAKGSIDITLNRDAHLQMGNAAEVVGKVQSDLTIRAYQASDFGSTIDYNAVDAVVDATHRYKEIFYDAE